MARRRTTADKARHAAEQRRHRQRLEAGQVRGPGQGDDTTPCGRIPETKQVDVAVTVAVYDLMRSMAGDDGAKGRHRFLKKAAAVLAAQGFDEARSLTLLRRRLLAPCDRWDALLGREAGDWDYLTA